MIKSFILVVLFTISSFYSSSAQIQYIENIGQWEDHILYKADLSGGYLFAEKDRITFVVSEADKIHHHHIASADIHVEGEEDDEVFGSFSYQVEFLNANQNTKIKSSLPSTTYHNYFNHADPSNWRSNVKLFSKVAYQKIYNGIDLALYSKDNLFEYDFIVEPGADINQIRLKYKGIDNLRVINGQLHLYTPIGTLVELAPIVYQEVNGNRSQVKAKFTIQNNDEIGFEMLEPYNTNKTLIIDPILVFSTYSGSFSDNWGFTATYDNDGNLYSGGMVAGNGYPATIGAYDTIYSGGESSTQTDIAISKYSPDGQQLIYATYLGGSANEIPHSLIATDDNELIVYGTTGSTDYPVTANAYDKTFNGGTPAFPSSGINYLTGSDIIITRLNESGSNLIGSTYFGGNGNDGLNIASNQSLGYNYGDFARGDLALTSNGDIIFASCTYSDDLPTNGNSLQSTKDADQSSLIARFNNELSDLVWVTYYGGSGDDAAYSIELLNNEIVIGGGTNSDDLTGMTGLNTTYQGGQADGFILKLDENGTSSIAATYLGTSAYDQAYFLEADRDGNIYALGQTLGTYPVLTNGFNVQNGTQFIHQLDNSLNQSIYSMAFGSPFSANETRRVNISLTAFLVDKCKNIYAIGWGGSVNNGFNNLSGNTFNMETTSDAFIDSTDGSDFYLMVIDGSSEDLLFASYFGEVSAPGIPLGRDHVDGGTSRFDKNGFVYHASCASCGGLDNFPTTDNAWSNTNNSSNCNTASFKIEFENAPIVAALDADPISGCPPLEVNFENFSNLQGEYYFWDFDDGTTSTLENPSHTFTMPGTYDVEFIIIDSNNCVVADTANIQIFVSETINETKADFSFADSSCLRSNINFTNLSENANNYLWDFGDGAISDDANPIHDYNQPGTYDVVLIADPGSGCSDTITQTINIFPNTIDAILNFNQSSCSDSNISIQFMDSSFSDNNITEWLWDFGDGTFSSLQNPSHQFPSAGSYTVNLIVTDNVGCTDFAALDVLVTDEIFEASFASFPNCDPLNLGTQFNDSSGFFSNVVSWQWDFGDGNQSNEESPLHFYTAVGTYTVQLIATNDLGCTDTATQIIDIQATQITVSFTADSLECNSSVISFTNTTTSQDSIVQWFWDFGNGTFSSEENPTIDFVNTGNFNVTLYANTASGCISSNSQFISIPVLDVEVTVTPPQGCSNINLPFNFMVMGTSSSAPSITEWNFGDGTPPISGFSVFHTYTETGTYDVTYIIENLQGCQDTVINTVVISDSIQVDITANPISCGSLTIDFEAIVTTQDSITSISWDFGDGNTLNDVIAPSHTYADTGNYTVQITVQTADNCDGSSITVLELGLSEVTAAFDLEPKGCNPLQIELLNQTTSSDSIAQYDWNFGDGNTSTLENPIHTYDGAGSYTITLIVSSISNCIDTFSSMIQLEEIETTLPDSVTTCAGDSILLPLVTNFGTSYTWSPSTGLNDNTIAQPTAAPSVTTTYIVVMQETSANGTSCSLTDTIVVEITTDAAIVDIIASPTTCGSLTVNFTASSLSDSITSIVWDFGDGTTQNDVVNTSHTYSDTGTYLVEINYETAQQCSGSNSAIVELDLSELTAAFDFEPQSCHPLEIELFNQTTSTDSVVQYNWNFGDGNTSLQENPTHLYDNAGSYSITLIANSLSGCSDTVSRNIQLDTIEISLVDSLFICEGDSILLPLLSNFGNTFTWSPDQSLNDNSIAQPIASPMVTTTYSVTIEEIAANGDTCSEAENVVVVVNPNPSVIATSDQYSVSEGTTINLDATSGFDSYDWSPASEVSDPSINHPTADISDDIIFEVEVTDENGCTNTDTVNIRVVRLDSCSFETLYIPNAFSPNGDGQNDQLFIRLMGEYDRLDFRIYNRWGELVFETDDINVGWDGVFKGRTQSTDVFGYVFEIQCEDEILTRQGNITLVR